MSASGSARAAPRAAGSLLPDLLVSLGVLATGGLALWQAYAIPASPIYAQVGPRAVPYAVAAGLIAAGGALTYVALRGGWSHALPEAPAAPTNWRALTLLFVALATNLVLIVPLGFSIAAAAQFVLVAAAFGSRRPVRDALIALLLCLTVWFGFTAGLGVNIGAGVLEGLVLRLLGREPA